MIIYGREFDSIFIVEVPELPGSRLDGQTDIEAVTNVEVVIQKWIKRLDNCGVPFQNLKEVDFLPNEFL